MIRIFKERKIGEGPESSRTARARDFKLRLSLQRRLPTKYDELGIESVAQIGEEDRNNLSHLPCSFPSLTSDIRGITERNRVSHTADVPCG